MDNWARLRILGASAIGGYVLYKIYVLKRRKDAFYTNDADALSKERKPSLTAAKPVATKPFAAFISHYKAEAAMEARFLQSKLELALSGRRCSSSSAR